MTTAGTPLVSSYNRSRPHVPASAQVVDRWEQAGQLRDGTADVGLMRTPFDARGLDSDEFLREPRVVLLKEDNPLAARPDTELRHLAGLPIIRCVPDRGNGVLL